MREQSRKAKKLFERFKKKISVLRRHFNTNNKKKSNLQSFLDERKIGDIVNLLNQWQKACINLYKQNQPASTKTTLPDFKSPKRLIQMISGKLFSHSNINLNREYFSIKETFFSKKALVIYFQFWTLALLVTTLNLQHSCTPMLSWSNEISATCSELAEKTTIALKPSAPQKSLNSSSSHTFQKSVRSTASDKKPTTTKKVTNPTATGKSPNYSTSSSYPKADAIGLSAGATTALVVGGITTAPVTVAVGAGVFVWWLMRSLLSN